MGGNVQHRRQELASEGSATAVQESPTLRVAILQVSVVIAVAVAIVLAVVAAPAQAATGGPDGQLMHAVHPGTAHER
ncbi:hypothetical protein L5G32_15195 [Gordonia sp. HY002]|uniref:hypothetical protein n=1 Tax=Gordonia zhenghanii TaxID=2911516 RepID=UPI001EF04860|nr:hypothetical protein [Gordonia zhenghanii]MCF8571617.1 hypothetical protein [Gordonia zhenghanii]MCF8602214.1 hypothetical protein [Gordonia zhenghanii]